MNHTPPDSTVFKYKLSVADGGSVEHGKGSYDGSYLRFADREIPIKSVAVFQAIGSAFVISYFDDEELITVNLEVYNTDVDKLARAIYASWSRSLAEAERTHLSKSGKLANYRDTDCPFCQSTIALTDLPETDQVYCNFCDTLYSLDRSIIGQAEQNFRICEGCGMYSRPRKFAIVYFYFLVFTFGFHHDSVVRCSGCMRKSSWKMVLGNIFGLLGLPFALIQLYRSYSTRSLTGQFEGLDTANLMAGRGKIESALEKYDVIMDNAPENAGVKFNIALGLMIKKDYEHAQQMFELSLDDCSNYWPAVNGLLDSLRKQGKAREIRAVSKIWGSPEISPESSF